MVATLDGGASDEFVWAAASYIATHGHQAREDTMGELIVTEFVTLDGVAQAPGGPDEDRDSGFAHGGWQAPLLDEESGDCVQYMEVTVAWPISSFT